MSSQVEFLGMEIVEPMTMLTDYLIAVAAAYFAIQLTFSSENHRHLARRFWGAGFGIISIGALLGGTSHGFVNYLDNATIASIWTGTLATVGLSMAFAVAGTVVGTVSSATWRAVLHGLNIAGLVFYCFWVMQHSGFVAVIAVTVVSLGVVALLQLPALLQGESSGARWLIAGVLISFLSAAIQRSGLTLHLHFNHNDLYHMVQLLGLYLLYRGASQIQDRNGMLTKLH